MGNSLIKNSVPGCATRRRKTVSREALAVPRAMLKKARAAGPLQALQIARAHRESGSEQPKPHPTSIAPQQIRQEPGLFQHRNPSPYDSEQHVRGLAAAIKDGASLDPITVWWGGYDYICIDGHHRLAAYRATGREQSAVPVEVFDGSLTDAVAEAARRNTRRKLQMTPAERANAAWRLTVLCPDSMTKKEVAEATGVSTSTVANMRRTLGLLQMNRDSGHDWVAFTWDQVQVVMKSDARDEAAAGAYDREEAKARLKSDLIRGIGRARPPASDLLAEVLREVFGSEYAGGLAEALNTPDQESDDEDEPKPPGWLPFPGDPRRHQPEPTTTTADDGMVEF